MVTITLHCPHCQSDALVRNGRVPNGKQKYLCRAAHSTKQGSSDPACLPRGTRAREILCACQERSNQRGLERTFGVSRTTILAWIKKSLFPRDAQRGGLIKQRSGSVGDYPT